MDYLQNFELIKIMNLYLVFYDVKTDKTRISYWAMVYMRNLWATVLNLYYVPLMYAVIYRVKSTA